MQAVMKDCGVIQKLLAMIAGEKLQEGKEGETELPAPPEVVAADPSKIDQAFLTAIHGATLTDKLYNVWIRLQSHVNIVFDSDMDKIIAEKIGRAHV